MKTAMDKDLKKRIKDFYMKHGRKKAEDRLRGYGFSLSMVQKLLAGTYPHQPEGLYLKALNEALEGK